ncbi:MAG: transposase [Acidiferrobacter sp.]
MRGIAGDQARERCRGDDPRQYPALVTDWDLPSVEIWRSYRGRADCENRIKELKYDFATDSFCLDDFWATEASLNTALLAYNLMSLFRQAVLRSSVLQNGGKDVQHTLKTLRYKLFAKAGYTTTEGRKDILKLAIAMRQREGMEGLWDRSKTFSLPVRFTPTFSSA